MRAIVWILIPLLFFFGVTNVYENFVTHKAPKLHSYLKSEKPVILSHRGSRLLNPENTLLAFQNSLDIGADVIEYDVHLTKDNQLVVIHDDTVNRTTDGVGDVRGHTLAELKALDAGYRYTPDNGTTFPMRGKGLQIPTFKEVLDAFPNTPMNIEIKDPDELAADYFFKELSAYKGIEDYVVVGGRFCTSVSHFRKLAAKAGLNIHTSACESEVVSFFVHNLIGSSALWYGLFGSIEPQVFQIPTESGPLKLDDSNFLRRTKYLGLQIHYWVINNEMEMKRVLALGANGIITDRPDIAVKVWEDFGFKTPKESVPDTTTTHGKKWFVPAFDYYETHTCVSALCLFLKMVNKFVVFGVLGVIVSISMLCCGGSSKKSAPTTTKSKSANKNNNRNTNNTTKKKKGKKQA